MVAALLDGPVASLNASHFVSRDEADRNGFADADDAAFEAARRSLAIGPMTLGLPVSTPVHLRLPRRDGTGAAAPPPNPSGGVPDVPRPAAPFTAARRGARSVSGVILDHEDDSDAERPGTSSVAPPPDTDRAWPGATSGPTKIAGDDLDPQNAAPVAVRPGHSAVRRRRDPRQKPEAACDAGLHRAERVAPRNQGTAGRPAVERIGGAQARAVLRQVIRELRGLFTNAGFDGLRIGAHEIGFEPDQIEVDVWSVIRSAEAEEAHPLLLGQPRLGDELLAGLEDLDPAFRGWVLAKRETLRDRLMRLLETALADDRLDPRKESTLAEAILNLDPTHEDACRRLMRARAVAGDTAGALRAYKALWDLLDEDYGMEPAPLTQQLVAEIKSGEFEQAVPEAPDRRLPAPAPAQTWPPARSTPDLIAPLVVRQETRLKLSLRDVIIHAVDADKAHLVDGFRQHLIGSLVRFREWQVTDAPFSEPAASGTPGSAGRYELQMTAHQTGEAVNLLLVLKELETNHFIWSDGFELKLENWFDSQRRVVRRIAMALNVYLSAKRLERFSEEPDVSLEHLRQMVAPPDSSSNLWVGILGSRGPAIRGNYRSGAEFRARLLRFG